MTNDFLSGKAAIVGIGATEFSKNSGRSELQLAAEAVLAAVADAGLTPQDVDGLSTFVMETNPETAVARTLGIPELTFFTRVSYGGGAACAPVQQAAMAVATGIADVVVVYRAFNERSGVRFGQGPPPGRTAVTAENEHRSWVNPYGLLTPAQWVAMFATRYLPAFSPFDGLAKVRDSLVAGLPYGVAFKLVSVSGAPCQVPAFSTTMSSLLQC